MVIVKFSCVCGERQRDERLDGPVRWNPALWPPVRFRGCVGAAGQWPAFHRNSSQVLYHRDACLVWAAGPQLVRPKRRTSPSITDLREREVGRWSYQAPCTDMQVNKLTLLEPCWNHLREEIIVCWAWILRLPLSAVVVGKSLVCL